MSSSSSERLAALEVIVAAQQAELDRRSRAGKRFKRRLSVATLAVVLLLMPLLARGGSMQTFDDVPPSHPFFESIDAVYQARIATGCGGGNFCPNATVTRGQMAAFLERGLGSTGQSGFVETIEESDVVTLLDTIAFKPGTVANGAAYVQLDAAVNVFTSEAGCPCEIEFWLEDDDGFALGPHMFLDIAGINAGDEEADGLVSVISVALAWTGVYNKFHLMASRTLGTADFTAYGHVTAGYFPFTNLGEGEGNIVTPPRPGDGG